MGGHGHGHGHEPPYKVPSPDVFKVEDVPQLVELRERLAKKGLKDPWLRNEVWRYRNVSKYSSGVAWGLHMLKGLWIGLPLFLITIAAENALGIDYNHKPQNGDHHGGEHGHH